MQLSSFRILIFRQRRKGIWVLGNYVICGKERLLRCDVIEETLLPAKELLSKNVSFFSLSQKTTDGHQQW